jgi:DNA-directed RNA polymerase subunit RPC12/RpoP
MVDIMKNTDKDFDKAIELFLETNQDKLEKVGKCPYCGSIVMYNFLNQNYACLDCMFDTEDIEEIENWKINE